MGFWATVPLIIITSLIPEQILGVFGEEFQTAAIPLIILLIGQIFNTVNGPTGIVLQLTGHQKVFKNIILVSSIINIALNYILIPMYGLVGAAIANSFSLILWNVWCSIKIKTTFLVSLFFYLPFLPKMNDFLPNFLLVGAAKSGTTSLFDQLCHHPEVFKPYIKEPGYFIPQNQYSSINTWEEYLNIFKGRR